MRQLDRPSFSPYVVGMGLKLSYGRLPPPLLGEWVDLSFIGRAQTFRWPVVASLPAWKIIAKCRELAVRRADALVWMAKFEVFAAAADSTEVDFVMRWDDDGDEQRFVVREATHEGVPVVLIDLPQASTATR